MFLAMLFGLALIPTVQPPSDPPIVTLDLASSITGTTIAPFSPVDWTITAFVPAVGNLGLGGIVVDLVQDPGNPAFVDLSSAFDVPSAMAGFSRPAGISNPSPGGGVPGYCGTPLGISGAMNVRQIGGLQNTFGVAGSTIGQDTTLETLIGQDTGGQVIATGSFPAPPAVGTYIITLTAGSVNVLDNVVSPPEVSIVRPATVVLGSFSFSVHCFADFNGDGFLDPLDYNGFINAFEAGSMSADVNYDGFLDPLDYNGFINHFEAGC